MARTSKDLGTIGQDHVLHRAHQLETPSESHGALADAPPVEGCDAAQSAAIAQRHDEEFSVGDEVLSPCEQPRRIHERVASTAFGEKRSPFAEHFAAPACVVMTSAASVVADTLPPVGAERDGVGSPRPRDSLDGWIGASTSDIDILTEFRKNLFAQRT